MSPRFFALAGAATLIGCSAKTGGEGLEADITWEPRVAAQCFKLRLEAEGHAALETSAMPRDTKTVLEVGIARANLPSAVSLHAIGYLDTQCTTASGETSPVADARFSSPVATVTLTVMALAQGDGGPADAGTDAGVDAGTDAGVDAGFDAGVDAGTDAGVDAGFDAGVDAGTDGGVDGGADAGLERCDNRIDDNGDGLIDCADPQCPVTTPCDDADLCTQNDRCMSGGCRGALKACSGPVPACWVPAGCDAGMCLATPEPDRTFCDGGQCNGAGRCAPFCDPARATLAACYQFEQSLADGSRYGNSGTLAGTATYGPGARGRALAPSTSGMRVADAVSLDCASALTLEAWVRLDALPDAGQRMGVIDDDGQYGMFVYPNGQLRCSISAGGFTDGGLVIGRWQHLACVFDGFTVRSYIDGALVLELDAGLPDGGFPLLGQGSDAGLAIGQNSPTADVLIGHVDGVRIWCEAHAPIDFCAVLGECG